MGFLNDSLGLSNCFSQPDPSNPHRLLLILCVGLRRGQLHELDVINYGKPFWTNQAKYLLPAALERSYDSYMFFSTWPARIPNHVAGIHVTPILYVPPSHAVYIMICIGTSSILSVVFSLLRVIVSTASENMHFENKNDILIIYDRSRQVMANTDTLFTTTWS